MSIITNPFPTRFDYPDIRFDEHIKIIDLTADDIVNNSQTFSGFRTDLYITPIVLNNKIYLIQSPLAINNTKTFNVRNLDTLVKNLTNKIPIEIPITVTSIDSTVAINFNRKQITSLFNNSFPNIFGLSFKNNYPTGSLIIKLSNSGPVDVLGNTEPGNFGGNNIDVTGPWMLTYGPDILQFYSLSNGIGTWVSGIYVGKANFTYTHNTITNIIVFTFSGTAGTDYPGIHSTMTLLYNGGRFSNNVAIDFEWTESATGSTALLTAAILNTTTGLYVGTGTWTVGPYLGRPAFTYTNDYNGNIVFTFPDMMTPYSNVEPATFHYDENSFPFLIDFNNIAVTWATTNTAYLDAVSGTKGFNFIRTWNIIDANYNIKWSQSFNNYLYIPNGPLSFDDILNIDVSVSSGDILYLQAVDENGYNLLPGLQIPFLTVVVNNGAPGLAKFKGQPNQWNTYNIRDQSLTQLFNTKFPVPIPIFNYTTTFIGDELMQPAKILNTDVKNNCLEFIINSILPNNLTINLNIDYAFIMANAEINILLIIENSLGNIIYSKLYDTAPYILNGIWDDNNGSTVQLTNGIGTWLTGTTSRPAFSYVINSYNTVFNFPDTSKFSATFDGFVTIDFNGSLPNWTYLNNISGSWSDTANNHVVLTTVSPTSGVGRWVSSPLCPYTISTYKLYTGPTTSFTNGFIPNVDSQVYIDQGAPLTFDVANQVGSYLGFPVAISNNYSFRTITGCTLTKSVASVGPTEITTSVAHHLVAGDKVIIAGYTGTGIPSSLLINTMQIVSGFPAPTSTTFWIAPNTFEAKGVPFTGITVSYVAAIATFTGATLTKSSAPPGPPSIATTTKITTAAPHGLVAGNSVLISFYTGGGTPDQTLVNTVQTVLAVPAPTLYDFYFILNTFDVTGGTSFTGIQVVNLFNTIFTINVDTSDDTTGLFPSIRVYYSNTPINFTYTIDPVNNVILNFPYTFSGYSDDETATYDGAVTINFTSIAQTWSKEVTLEGLWYDNFGSSVQMSGGIGTWISGLGFQFNTTNVPFTYEQNGSVWVFKFKDSPATDLPPLTRFIYAATYDLFGNIVFASAPASSSSVEGEWALGINVMSLHNGVGIWCASYQLYASFPNFEYSLDVNKNVIFSFPYTFTPGTPVLFDSNATINQSSSAQVFTSIPGPFQVGMTVLLSGFTNGPSALQVAVNTTHVITFVYTPTFIEFLTLDTSTAFSPSSSVLVSIVPPINSDIDNSFTFTDNSNPALFTSTVAIPHNLLTGDSVVISGFVDTDPVLQEAINTVHVVTVTSPTAFTVPVDAFLSSTTGQTAITVAYVLTGIYDGINAINISSGYIAGSWDRLEVIGEIWSRSPPITQSIVDSVLLPITITAGDKLYLAAESNGVTTGVIDKFVNITNATINFVLPAAGRIIADTAFTYSGTILVNNTLLSGFLSNFTINTTTPTTIFLSFNWLSTTLDTYSFQFQLYRKDPINNYEYTEITTTGTGPNNNMPPEPNLPPIVVFPSSQGGTVNFAYTPSIKIDIGDFITFQVFNANDYPFGPNNPNTGTMSFQNANIYSRFQNVQGVINYPGRVHFFDTTDAPDNTDGAVVIDGSLGVALSLNAAGTVRLTGGNLNLSGSSPKFNITSSTSTSLIQLLQNNLRIQEDVVSLGKKNQVTVNSTGLNVIGSINAITDISTLTNANVVYSVTVILNSLYNIDPIGSTTNVPYPTAGVAAPQPIALSGALLGKTDLFNYGNIDIVASPTGIPPAYPYSTIQTLVYEPFSDIIVDSVSISVEITLADYTDIPGNTFTFTAGSPTIFTSTGAIPHNISIYGETVNISGFTDPTNTALEDLINAPNLATYIDPTTFSIAVDSTAAITTPQVGILVGLQPMGYSDYIHPPYNLYVPAFFCTIYDSNFTQLNSVYGNVKFGDMSKHYNILSITLDTTLILSPGSFLVFYLDRNYRNVTISSISFAATSTERSVSTLPNLITKSQTFNNEFKIIRAANFYSYTGFDIVAGFISRFNTIAITDFTPTPSSMLFIIGDKNLTGNIATNMDGNLVILNLVIKNNTGFAYILNNNGANTGTFYNTAGVGTDTIAIGDYAIYKVLLNSETGTYDVFKFGTSSSVPVPSQTYNNGFVSIDQLAAYTYTALNFVYGFISRSGSPVTTDTTPTISDMLTVIGAANLTGDVYAPTAGNLVTLNVVIKNNGLTILTLTMDGSNSGLFFNTSETGAASDTIAVNAYAVYKVLLNSATGTYDMFRFVCINSYPSLAIPWTAWFSLTTPSYFANNGSGSDQFVSVTSLNGTDYFASGGTSNWDYGTVNFTIQTTGTYRLTFISLNQFNTGIIDFTLDGTTIESYNQYDPGSTSLSHSWDWSITQGNHTLQLVNNDKDPSSTGYNLQFNCNGLTLYRIS